MIPPPKHFHRIFKPAFLFWGNIGWVIPCAKVCLEFSAAGKNVIMKRGETLLIFHSKQATSPLKHQGFYFEISFPRRSRGAARSPGRGSWAVDQCEVCSKENDRMVISPVRLSSLVHSSKVCFWTVERFFKLKLLSESRAAATSGPPAVQCSCRDHQPPVDGMPLL